MIYNTLLIYPWIITTKNSHVFQPSDWLTTIFRGYLNKLWLISNLVDTVYFNISRSCILRNWIYHGCMLDPFFHLFREFCRCGAQECDIWNRNNPLHPIRGGGGGGGGAIFVKLKSVHCKSLCFHSPGSNFHKINSSPTVYIHSETHAMRVTV